MQNKFFNDMMLRQRAQSSDEAGGVYFFFFSFLAECSLGIIKRCDITYLQEPRRATCPVNVGEDQCMSLLIGCGFKMEQ